MGCKSPATEGCERIQPRAKSEASASIVSGRSGWKCWRTGAVVKDFWRLRKVAAAASDQVNRIFLRARVVRGAARNE